MRRVYGTHVINKTLCIAFKIYYILLHLFHILPSSTLSVEDTLSSTRWRVKQTAFLSNGRRFPTSYPDGQNHSVSYQREHRSTKERNSHRIQLLRYFKTQHISNTALTLLLPDTSIVRSEQPL